MSHKKFNLKAYAHKAGHNINDFLNDKWTIVCILNGVITNYAFDAATNIYGGADRIATLIEALEKSGRLDVTKFQYHELLAACGISPVQHFIFIFMMALAVYSLIMLLIAAKHLIHDGSLRSRGLHWSAPRIHWWNLL